MMIYYNLSRQTRCNEFGMPLNGNVPQLRFKEQPQWSLCLLDNEGNPFDMTGITSFRIAVDTDFSHKTTPIMRTLDENIDQSEKQNGILTFTLNANTVEFQNAVDGVNNKKAYFELWGLDQNGHTKLYVIFEIRIASVIDPDGGDLPEEVPSDYMTVTQVQSIFRAANEHQFTSLPGGQESDFHTEQTVSDTHFRYRNPAAQTEWSPWIKLPEATNPHVGDNGNWFVGSEDTGVNAQGPQGLQGPQGIQGIQGVQGEKGDSALTFKVGTVTSGDTPSVTANMDATGLVTLDFVLVPGKQGVDGLQGAKGDNALSFQVGTVTPGAEPAVTATTDENGLVTLNFVLAKGDKGDTGAQGIQGIQGVQGDKGDKGEKGDKGDTGNNGADGVTPHIGENNNWFLGSSDTGVPAVGFFSNGVPPFLFTNSDLSNGILTKTFAELGIDSSMPVSVNIISGDGVIMDGDVRLAMIWEDAGLKVDLSQFGSISGTWKLVFAGGTKITGGGGGGSGNGYTRSVLSQNTTVQSGYWYICTASGLTLTLPAGSTGDYIRFSTNYLAENVVIKPADGETIDGDSEGFTLDKASGTVEMLWTGSEWTVIEAK